MSISDNTFESIMPAMFHIVDRYCDPNWIVLPAVWGIHNFILVVSGEGVCITDGVRHEMRPGMLVYHSSIQSFGFETSQTDMMHVFGVNFSVASIKTENGQWIIQNIEKLPFPNLIHVSNMDVLIKYFSDLTDIWESEKANKDFKLCSIFLNILHEVLDQERKQKENKYQTRELDEVIKYIHSHFKQHIKLQTLADLTGLNRNYFCSIFRDYTGKSPFDYLNSVRIKKAEEYLGIGYSINETASRVGFNDPFYFSKVFKKYKGVAPKAYSKTPMHYF